MALFSRAGCHLCEAVEAELQSMKPAGGVTVVDIDHDADLQTKYFLRIPVVVVGGREVFEARMMDREGMWKDKLRSMVVGRS